VSANVPERRRYGKRQSHVGFLRRLERNLRRVTSLAFPSEGDADAAESKPARTRRRRLPSRPDEFLLQETDHGDEYCQWMSTVCAARRPRQSLKWVRQGRSAFSQGRCGLFRFILNAFRRTGVASEKMFYYNAVLRCLIMPLHLLDVHVVRGGEPIPLTGRARGSKLKSLQERLGELPSKTQNASVYGRMHELERKVSSLQLELTRADHRMTSGAPAADEKMPVMMLIKPVNCEMEKMTVDMEALERQRRMERELMDNLNRKVRSTERLIAMQDATINELNIRLTSVEQCDSWSVGLFDVRVS